jgi:hypothetical protein
MIRMSRHRATAVAAKAVTRDGRQAARGSEMTNDVPTRGSLVTLIVPSCASTIAFTIGKPSPLP